MQTLIFCIAYTQFIGEWPLLNKGTFVNQGKQGRGQI